MKNLSRALRKKLQRYYKPGDWVTWGRGVSSHRVVEVTPRGVFVDITSDNSPHIGIPLKDGRRLYFVAFDGNVRQKESMTSSRGPVRKVDLKDTAYTP